LYHLHVTAISAFILAGGKGSRMGVDKAFLELGGRTLLARVLELALLQVFMPLCGTPKRN